MPRFLIEHRLAVTVAVALTAILVGPALGLYPWAVSLTAALAACLLAVAAKEVFDAWFFGLLTLVLVFQGWISVWRSNLESEILLLRTFSTSAFILLNLVLLIGPWSRFSRRVLRVYRHRRRLGLTAFLLALSHSALASRIYFNFSLTAELQTIFVFFGLCAIYLLTFLAVTSSDRAQTRLSRRSWVYLHAAALTGYALLIAVFLLVLNAKAISPPLWAWPFFATTLVFGLLSSPVSPLAKKMELIMGWKQVHVLIWIAWLSVVVHSWSGVVSRQGAVIQIPYLLLVGFVFFSHALGWYKKFSEDRRARERVRRIGKSIEENGERWIGLARLEEFKDGVGEKFIVSGRSLAVFKLADKFMAVSEFCAHQKGPLHQGTISKNGYLTCPWHGWQYSTADGCGPKSSGGVCVPFYPTRVVEGVLFVREAPAKCPGGCRTYPFF